MWRNFAAVATLPWFLIGCRDLSVGAQIDCRTEPITLQRKCETTILRGPFALLGEPGFVDFNSVTTEGVLDSYALLGGAASIVVDTSGSTVGLPVEAPITNSLVNATGQAYASRQFAAVRSGAEFRASNPAEVDAWMFANGASVVSYEAVFGPVNVTAVSGANAYLNSLEVAGAVVASSGRVWTERTCSSCRYDP